LRWCKYCAGAREPLSLLGNPVHVLEHPGLQLSRYAIKRKDMVAKGLNALGEYRKQALSARPKVVSLHAAAQGRSVKA